MLSANNKEEQKLADQLIKNSVILDHLCRSEQPYSIAAEPQPRQLSVANTYIDSAAQLAQNPAIQ